MFKKKSNAGRKPMQDEDKMNKKIIFGLHQDQFNRLDELSGLENINSFARKIIWDFLRRQDNDNKKKD